MTPEKRTCKKCGLIQLHDPLFGLAICDSKESFVYGCPLKERLLEVLPESEYDSSIVHMEFPEYPR